MYNWDIFLEPEVRDGFYVPSAVKQAWAAELELLKVIDGICKKHNIPYFADWGTLLGTVRHGGFIPWDDDLDITMKRADYERFLQVAPREIPDGFEIFTYKTHPDFWSFMARFVAKNKICFEKEHMDRFHGFPYIVGVDIFVLDYVPEDENKGEDRNKLARYVLAVADEIAKGKLTGKQADEELNQIERRFGIQLNDRCDLYALRVKLYEIVEKLFARFSEEESKELTRMMPDGLYGNKRLRLLKEYYDQQVWLPFENTLIPVPSGYDEMLRRRYGDYMKIVRNTAGHDYPFFETQKKQLQAVLDFEMPGYRYTGVAPRDVEQGRSGSLKEIIRQAAKELQKCHQILINQETLELEVLQDVQQWAIDIGTLIDNCKGEGHPTVCELEYYCEVVFELSQNDTELLRNKLDVTLNRVLESVKKDILDRKEVVFLPYKAKQWDYMRSVWQSAVEDENCDVYVIPIPYFYKEYDGALRDMQYEADAFPENVKITKYDEFDFALHYPDAIYIQNPYDEFDPVISVHTYFYSANLRNFTEQLVYIPPFVVEEFKKDCYCEYLNMKHYCTVPGVVNADKVIVQSENMKQLYVEKLTEFAGEDTRTIWEEKVVSTGSQKEDVKITVMSVPEEWMPYVVKADGGRKKIVLYHVSLSSFIQYKEQTIEKIKRVFQTFSDAKDEITVLWKPHPLINTTLEQLNPELYRTYCGMRQEYIDSEIGILDENRDDELSLAVCDAYYGDASPMMQKCRTMEKPVMQMSIEV